MVRERLPAVPRRFHQDRPPRALGQHHRQDAVADLRRAVDADSRGGQAHGQQDARSAQRRNRHLQQIQEQSLSFNYVQSI